MLTLQVLLLMSCTAYVVYGIDSSLNVVGEAVKTGEGGAPWIASLQIDEGDFAYCGAALIHTYQDADICKGFIVTAASCLEDIPTTIVTYGNLNLANTSAGIPSNIIDIISHKNYKEDTNENDISLLHVQFLESKADEDTCAKKFVSLPYVPKNKLNETHYPEINATMYGWGLRMENGPLQKELYNTTIALKTNQECADIYGHEVFKPESMICAGGRGRGPCSYDTGGPLVCHYKEENTDATDIYLCGIASFGSGCGPDSPPAIFTAISQFQDWIDANINEKTQATTTTTVTTSKKF